MNNSIRSIRTLGYLKLSQAFFFIKRRVLPERKYQLNNYTPSVRKIHLVDSIPSSGIFINDFEFQFLNERCDIKNDNIDWCPEQMSRLWQYNLHYFEYLNESERTQENKAKLITDWINNNLPNSKPGWEPYTASLRIVNWIKFFTNNASFNKEQWNNSLFNQIVWLEKNLEKHILANHYFENIKALLFASYYFSDGQAFKWREIAEQELIIQLDEQFLDDGGHYEKTPQYHCRMMENCLDIYNLLLNNPENRNSKLYYKVKDVCESGLDFLNSILYPDNTIPLFNDSALSTSEYPNEIINYAERLGISKIENKSNMVSHHESGLFGYKTTKDYFMVDCGDIGPLYQPGHTHCDFLSYELCINNKKIVVDSGVYEYQKGEMRDYVRSTKAHNTISIDDDEQSEIWGEFRVARRAKKNQASIERNESKIRFVGSYNGFYKLGGNVTHERKIEIDLEPQTEKINSIKINDMVFGLDGVHKSKSYIHFHPNIIIKEGSDSAIQILDGCNIIATITIDNKNAYQVESSFYCPEFGVKYTNQCIVIERKGIMPLKSGYRIDLH